MRNWWSPSQTDNEPFLTTNVIYCSQSARHDSFAIMKICITGHFNPTHTTYDFPLSIKKLYLLVSGL